LTDDNKKDFDAINLKAHEVADFLIEHYSNMGTDKMWYYVKDVGFFFDELDCKTNYIDVAYASDLEAQKRVEPLICEKFVTLESISLKDSEG